MAEPLETPLSLCRDFLPSLWDADLVGKKLVQAFVTLDRLPLPRGKQDGNHATINMRRRHSCRDAGRA
jgi:hypothetical protein